MNDKTQAVLPVYRQAIYNPSRLTDPEIKASFIARQAVFEAIRDDVAAIQAGSMPQHHLVIGQRGMGKTTLLRRIEVALREPPLASRFVPVAFPEEPYALDRLSKLWLNCLDSLADALEREGCPSQVAAIDAEVDRLRGEREREDLLAERIERAFRERGRTLGRRPVLLLDNLDMVFDRLNEHECGRLRAVLMQPDAPILIGASLVPPRQTTDYGASFYDHFKNHYLDRLTLEEMREVLLKLAEQSGDPAMPARLAAELPRLRALHALTGGNPRTTVTLHQIFAKGFSREAYDDLEALLDWVTPLYKARFEELAPQAQVVVSATALHWEPATSARLGELTSLANSQISAQLDRLKKAGLIEEVTVDPENRTGPLPPGPSPRDRAGYQLAERFFNIWFLMRQATRRDRRNLVFLTRFLQTLYTPPERESLARGLIERRAGSRAERAYGLALEDALENAPLRYELHDQMQLDLIRAERELQEKIADLIDPTEIPPQRFAFAELESRLRQTAGQVPGLEVEDFLDAILKSPVLLRHRELIAGQAFDLPKARGFQQAALEDAQLYRKGYGEEAARWMTGLLRRGTLTDPGSPQQMSEVMMRASSRQQAQMCVALAKRKALCRLAQPVWENVRRLLEPKPEVVLPDDWFEWAWYLQEKFGRPSEAEAAYRKAIQFAPGHLASWNNLGNVLQYDLRRPQEAEAAYRKAIELDSRAAPPWYGLGNLLRDHQGRYAESEVAYRKAIELDPRYAAPWNSLGNLLQNFLARPVEAEAAYRRAIELDPNSAVSWNNLGILLQNHWGRQAEAEVAYHQAILLDSASALPWNNLSSLLQRHLGRYVEAEAACRKAIELDSNDARSWTSLGYLLQYHLHRPTEAESAYRKAIELDSKDVAAWTNLGHLLQSHASRQAEAETVFRKAIELDPKDARPWNNLGILLHHDPDRRAEAEAACRKAIELDSHYAHPWANLGNLLQCDPCRHVEAEAAYRKAIELNSRDAHPWNGLGNLLADRLGRHQEALEALDQAIKLPGNVAPRLNKVFVLRDFLGRIADAEAEFKGIAIEPGQPFADSLALNQALFSAYAENWGDAVAHLGRALESLGERSGFPHETLDDWMRASAVLLHLGYGEKLMILLEQRGDDQRLRPWHEALRAHGRGDRRYLRNSPVEVQDAAGQLYDQIALRLGHLPASTRRWSPPGRGRDAAGASAPPGRCRG